MRRPSPLPVLAVLLLLLATGAQSFTISRSPDEPVEASNQSASTGEPDAWDWLTGSWKSDTAGIDVTMVYDDRSREAGAVLAADPNDETLVEAVDDLMRYHVGWVNGSFSIQVNTTTWTDAQDEAQKKVVPAASMSLEPGAGWFLNLHREPDVTDGYNPITDSTKWKPDAEAGEMLRYKVNRGPQDDALVCPRTSLTPLTSAQWVDVLALGQIRSDIDAEMNIDAREGQNEEFEYMEEDSYRSDRLNLNFFVPAFQDDTCHYIIDVEWRLPFVFEVARNPFNRNEDAAVETPLDPFELPEGTYPTPDEFKNESRVLTMGLYDYDARLSFTAGAPESTYALYLEPQRDRTLPPFGLSVLYAPIIPADWACDKVPSAVGLEECVDDALLNAVDGVVRFAIDRGESTTSLIATETFQGHGKSVVHTITSGVLDLTESLVFDEDPDGVLQNTPFLEVQTA